MTKWAMTATTIYCGAVDDEVTIIYKAGTVKCTGYKKYHTPDRETVRSIKIKSRGAGKKLGCDQPDCPRVSQYRDKLLAEECQP